MTFVCTTFIMVSKTAFALPTSIGYTVGIIVTIVFTVRFFWWHHKKFTLDYAYGKDGKKTEQNN